MKYDEPGDGWTRVQVVFLVAIGVVVVLAVWALIALAQ
jgi:hypothetical protein